MRTNCTRNSIFWGSHFHDKNIPCEWIMPDNLFAMNKKLIWIMIQSNLRPHFHQLIDSMQMPKLHSAIIAACRHSHVFFMKLVDHLKGNPCERDFIDKTTFLPNHPWCEVRFYVRIFNVRVGMSLTTNKIKPTNYFYSSLLTAISKHERHLRYTHNRCPRIEHSSWLVERRSDTATCSIAISLAYFSHNSIAKHTKTDWLYLRAGRFGSVVFKNSFRFHVCAEWCIAIGAGFSISTVFISTYLFSRLLFTVCDN